MGTYTREISRMETGKEKGLILGLTTATTRVNG